MGKEKKQPKEGFWRRRRGALPFIIIATIVIVVLFLNEETSVRTNMKYDNRINELKTQIQLNNDSAEYYRQRRIAVENGEEDLEELARVRYHMQKPNEEVFVYE